MSYSFNRCGFTVWGCGLITSILYYSIRNISVGAQDKLIKTINEKYDSIKNVNEKRIELKCSEAERSTEVCNQRMDFHINFCVV